MSAPTAEERGLATPGMSAELVDHIAHLQVEIVAFNEVDTYKSPLILWMEAL